MNRFTIVNVCNDCSQLVRFIQSIYGLIERGLSTLAHTPITISRIKTLWKKSFCIFFQMKTKFLLNQNASATEDAKPHLIPRKLLCEYADRKDVAHSFYVHSRFIIVGIVIPMYMR